MNPDKLAQAFAKSLSSQGFYLQRRMSGEELNHQYRSQMETLDASAKSSLGAIEKVSQSLVQQKQSLLEEKQTRHDTKTERRFSAYQGVSAAQRGLEDAKTEAANAKAALSLISERMKDAGASADEIAKMQETAEKNIAAHLGAANKALEDAVNKVMNFDKDDAKWNRNINKQIKSTEVQQRENKAEANNTEQQIQRKKAQIKKHYQIAEQKRVEENVYGRLSNGKSDAIHRDGSNLREFGKDLIKFGKSKGGAMGSAMQKMGGMAKSLGGGMMKAAGPVGAAITAINAAGKAVGAALSKVGEVLEFQAQMQELRNQKQQVIQQRQMAFVQLKGEELQAEQQNIITKAQNEISSKTGLVVKGNAIVQDAMASGVEIGLKSFTDIAGGAFAAYQKDIEIETAANKFNMAVAMQETLVNAQNKTADTILQTQKEVLEAKKDTATATANTQMDELNMQERQAKQQMTMKYLTEAAGIVGGPFGEGLQALFQGLSDLQKGSQAKDMANLRGENARQVFEAQMNETQKSIGKTLEDARAQFGQYAVEQVVNMAQQLYDQEQDRIQREKMAWLQFSQTVFTAFQKAESAAFQMGRAFGYNNEQLNTYAESLAQIQVKVSQWGKTLEDMMKLQTSYQETTGRNKIFSEEDFNLSFANGKLMGDDVVSQLNAGMEPFNKSVSDSNEMFYEMYRNVTKMGLSGKKYAKDLVQNLKLAEKYNFNGGVKSLMEMAKWAQNVRFNTGSLDGMLNKVQEGGLEGIIKQSAELQVLGGNFASGSDPLAMAYESFMDPEAYAKRLNGMLAGQGVMDSNTGEVSFGIASQQIMRQMAKSTGQDYKDVLAQAKQQVKVNKMKGEVSQNFDENQLAAIANNANFNNGVWTVETLNGTKNVSDLTAEDVATLSGQEDQTKSIEENVRQMLSSQEEMKGTEAKILSTMEKSLWVESRESAQQLIDNINNNFEKKFPDYLTNVDTYLKKLPQKQQDMIDTLAGQQPSSINNVVTSITGLQGAVVERITTTNQTLEDMARHFGVELENASNYDADVEEFLNHIKDPQWLQAALQKDTSQYKLMNRLYANMGQTMKSLGFSVGPDGNFVVDESLHPDKNVVAALELLMRYNPTGDHTSAAVSEEQYNAGLNMKLGVEGRKILNNSGYQNEDRFEEGASLYKGNVSDGLILQNGLATRIDNNDQVLAAKEGGPLDRMLDMVQPRPMKYDSFVSEIPYNNDSKSNNSFNNGNSELKISPIQIQITGNFNVNGSSVDFSSQLNNDPKLKEVLWSMISTEVAKKVGNTGKMVDPLYNRIQNIT